jgi:tetratricopeptide (TPR) repeat protein
MKHTILVFLVLIFHTCFSQSKIEKKPLTIDGTEIESIEMSKLKAERQTQIIDSIKKAEEIFIENEIFKADTVNNNDYLDFTNNYKNQQLLKLYYADNKLNIHGDAFTYDQCRDALDLYNSVDEKYIDAFTKMEIGFCLYVLQEYDKSVLYYTKAIIGLKNERYFYRDEVVYEDSTQYRIGARLEYAITVENVYYQRALSKMELKDIRGALNDFNLVEKSFIKSADYYIERGRCKLLLNKYLEAKVDLTKSLSLEKTSTAYYLRAFCNKGLNLKDSACNDFSKAGEMGAEGVYKEIKEYCYN